MLPSQVNQAPKAAMVLRGSSTPATRVLRSSNAAARRCRPQKQIRAFRLGLWSSYLDHNFQKETSRRNRIIKYKYLEAINRKLSWDRQQPGHARHLGLKSFMCSALRGHDARPGGRWVQMDEIETLQRSQKDKQNGIEDVEQSPIDRLLKDHKDRVDELIQTRSRLFGFDWGTASSKKENTREDNKPLTQAGKARKPSLFGHDDFKRRFQQSNTVSEADYEIDAITNRKVYKNKSNRSPSPTHNAINIPVKTFSEQPLSRNNDTVQEGLKDYDAKVSYEGGFYFNEPDGKSPTDSVQDGLKDYDSKISYKGGYFWNEPDGKPPRDTVAEGLKPYDDRVSYDGGFFWNEPDGTPPRDTVADGLKEYDDKVSYKGGFFWNEPDGKPPRNTVKEGLKDYDDKVSYKGGFFHNEPDGKPLSDTVKEGLKDYDDKVSYKGGFFHNEPDGKPSSQPIDTVQEGLKEYDSKTSYKGGFFHNEPDGKPTAAPIDPAQEGLKEYDSKASWYTAGFYAKEPDGKDPEVPCSVREALKDYEIKNKIDYSKGVYYLEPDGKKVETPCPVRESLKDYEINNNIDYNKGVYYLEPDGKKIETPCPVRESLKDYESKNNIDYQKGVYYLEPDGKTPESSPSKAPGLCTEEKTEDLDLLRASDVRAASGIIKSVSKESEADKIAERRELDEKYTSITTEVPSLDEEAASAKVHESRQLAKDLRIEHSELLNHHAHARGKVNAKIAEVEAGWPSAPEMPEKMTGNFFRDFPEEFQTKWTADTAESGALLPETSQATEPDLKLASGEAFNGSPDVKRLQPSLDRSTPEIEQKNPKNQADKELLLEIRGIYEDAYGTIDCNHRASVHEDSSSRSIEHNLNDSVEELNAELDQRQALKQAETATPTENPTLYKILAYDPTMQSINEAETTSIVTDSASPLTPAEVLLRLSNPAKFFPHFAPLQAQGYEIISGSGDVLIFRKVRVGAPPKPAGAKQQSFASEDYKRTGRNPIDGMQPIVATGNFASPTGFVNHDLPPPSEPAFKSNIDVRREEPVFSGQAKWNDESETSSQKTSGRGKKVLLGAAWVGACSYAIGVVAEFFKTGGIDGRGPTGF